MEQPGEAGTNTNDGEESDAADAVGLEARQSTDQPDDRKGEAERRREGQEEIVVAALGEGRSYQVAAEVAGVSRRTVARWMSQPVFARRVADRRGEHVTATAGSLTSLSPRAVEAVAACLDSDDPRTVVSAAKLILDMGAKFRNAVDLGRELAEIRSMLEEGGTGDALMERG